MIQIRNNTISLRKKNTSSSNKNSSNKKNSNKCSSNKAKQATNN